MARGVKIEAPGVMTIFILFGLFAFSAALAQETEPLDPSICDPGRGTFSLSGDHPYFPLTVGKRLVLEGVEEGAALRLEVSVLDEVEEVAGIQTRVVRETESLDGELVEVSRNFYAQAADGTVCYFGEEVDEYKDGKVVGHPGAWRAGESGNLPGIFLPANPSPGDQFAQERAPGIAEDMAAIESVGEAVSTPAGEFPDTLGIVDWNPLEGQTIADAKAKVFARGVGLVVDDVARLTEFD